MVGRTWCSIRDSFWGDAVIDINLHLSPNDLLWVFLYLYLGSDPCGRQDLMHYEDLVSYLSYDPHNQKNKIKDAAV